LHAACIAAGRIAPDAGTNYKPELLKRLGVEAQVLSGLINRLLIEKEDESLGIVISDDEVADALRTMPEFQNADKNSIRRCI